MRVLQVTAGLNEGGVERGTLEMAAFIVSKGGKSIVASHGGKLVPTLTRSGTKHFHLPLTRRDPFSILYCAVRLAGLIRAEQVEIVHARSRAPAWAAWLACRATGTSFITTFHGTHKIQNYFKKLYNSSMVRGERVIAISHFIKEHIVENYSVPENLIDIAHRGFDPDEFKPEDFSPEEKRRIRHDHGLSADDFVIALPGRLTRWKGQTVFLRALAQIKDRSWRALLIGGAGKKLAYENELKDLSKTLGLDDKVLFLGSQSHIAKFYAISDVIVSTSLEPEAFGRVAVEAQAMAKPVIASAHGGSLETVQNGLTGFLYKPGDSEELGRLIERVMNGDVDLRSVGDAGRSWVQENFTARQMCQAEWEAYHKVSIQ